MTTKTVVCPECGSTADPGRYGCSECGALLAAVAVAPRLWAGLEDEFDSAAPSARLDVVASGPADGAEVATNGTPEPSRIDKTNSHGCVRLTNWDVARAVRMLPEGTPLAWK